MNGKLNGETVHLMKDGEWQESKWKNGKVQKNLIFYNSKSQRIVF